MGLYEKAISDAAQITGDLSGFAVPMTITAPTSETVTFKGLTTEINLDVNSDGEIINSKKSTAAFAEKHLTDAGYPVRNSRDEVAIVGHRLSVKNSTGRVKEYVIQKCFPDETIGLLTCILSDFTNS